jgi:hypothetical protein
VKRVLPLVLAALLVAAASPAPAPATIVVTTQLLDFERGYLFFTSGDGFRVAPQVVVRNGPPAARDFARVTFDASSGAIVEIDVSRVQLPAEGDLSLVRKFAVQLSPPAPNPELQKPPQTRCARTRRGQLVSLSVTVQVPSTTALSDSVYMTSDTSGWNPQAYKLDRIDELHYRALLRLASGTQMHVLFDRGSTQSIQVSESGLEQQPYLLCIGDEDAQAFHVVVYQWGDQTPAGSLPQPQTFPTPYNPAPFPNLPTPAPPRES